MLNICALLGSNLIIRDIRVRTLLTTCDLIDLSVINCRANQGEFTPSTKHGIPWVGNGVKERGSSSTLGRTSVVQECDSSSGWTDKRTRLKLYHEVPPFCID